MSPSADLERGRKSGVILAAIVPELKLSDHERRVLHAEIQAVEIAGVWIAAGTWSGRIAIEDREQK